MCTHIHTCAAMRAVASILAPCITPALRAPLSHLIIRPAPARPQVDPCPKPYAHDWAACQCGHQGERAARRSLRAVPYRSIACPYVKKKLPCPDGDQVRACSACVRARTQRMRACVPASLLSGCGVYLFAAACLHPHGRPFTGDPAGSARNVINSSIIRPSLPRTTQCLNAHNLFEYWLHPER
jgi:hypothetical protein